MRLIVFPRRHPLLFCITVILLLLFSSPVAAQDELSIVTDSFPEGTVGIEYEVRLEGEGGETPYRWSARNLPAGLSIDRNDGIIQGIPETSGTFNVEITLRDDAGDEVEEIFDLEIIEPDELTIVNPSPLGLPDAKKGQSYATILQAEGGIAPYEWSIEYPYPDEPTKGLPKGLELKVDQDVGQWQITGIPEESGVFTFIVKVTDSEGESAARVVDLEVEIEHELEITTDRRLPAANPGYSYREFLDAYGGEEPYTWRLVSGELPEGLSLDRENGRISGTPVSVGVHTFTIQVTDAQDNSDEKEFTLNCGVLSIVTTELPTAYEGVRYAAFIEAEGGRTPYRFYLESGELPDGLLLRSDGRIEGRPRESGTFSFLVRVTDDADEDAHTTRSTDTQWFTLQVEDTEVLKPEIITPRLPSAEVGTSYQVPLAVEDGKAPYTWSLESGTMPRGLDMTADGLISGTPTYGGNFTFTVRVTDATGSTAEKQYIIDVAAVFITTDPELRTPLHSEYSTQLRASGGETPYTWRRVSGNMPVGLHLSESGTISGIPVRTGTYDFEVRVTDATGQSSTESLTMVIEDKDSPQVKTDLLPNAALHQSYMFYLQAENGEKPYKWSLLSGKLPDGINLHRNGALSGSPQQTGSFPFQVKVDDGNGNMTEHQVFIRVTKEPFRVNGRIVDTLETAIPHFNPRDEIRVEVNEKTIQMDTPPLLAEGRVLLPVRKISEAMDAIVGWHDEQQLISIEKNSYRVSLQLGFKEVMAGGQLEHLDVAPFVFENRTYIPLRFVAEHLDAEVNWDDITKTVVIKTD